ncbi:hypothetical protein HDV01_007856 [Terramyces sp. JEL0728]|nr:hypothetical protein HDV01_007856 [Terramyces sp. JEL0728]
MDTLPVELTLEILLWLDGIDLYKFLSTCKSYRKLIPFIPKLQYPENVSIKKSSINYTQNGAGLHLPLVDEILPPAPNYPQGRMVGLRTKGDRCIISRLPLGIQSSGWTTSNPYQAIYFEVEIMKGNGLPFRIGLVGDDWDMKRPPGSLPNSVGYCSVDGYISIGDIYDSRYMFGPSFDKGDVVGCGYTKATGNVFFTLNGKWVGEVPLKIGDVESNYSKRWYAAFSSSGPAHVTFNLGSLPFKYQMGKDNTVPFLMERESPDLKPKPQLVKCYPHIADEQDDLQVVDGWEVNFSSSPRFNRAVLSSVPLINCQKWGKRGYAYFEVKFVQPAVVSSFISIGLATKPYAAYHHIGWDSNSVGYHSDDGRVYAGNHSEGISLSVGYSEQNVIGVGYNPESRKVFFCHDGTKQSQEFFIDGHVYIAAAASLNWNIKVNLGREPFVFSEANII